jgi:AraC-like DNA-binding protein
MTYLEFLPSPPLRGIVDRIWFLEAPAEALGADPIPPDGHTEIIVHAGDTFREVRADGSVLVQDGVLLAGQTTRAVQVRPGGYARMVGARLRPDGARRFFPLPQHALTDGIHALGQIDRALARRLEDDVAGRRSPEGMAAALDAVLVRALPAHAPASSPASAAVSLALARRGLVRVDDLAAHAGVGARQLERLFQTDVGLAPKTLLRVTRFQQVLRVLREGASRSRWAAVAADCGFYDQSHFIRDFKTFVGTAPSAWSVDATSLAAVFSAIRRR